MAIVKATCPDCGDVELGIADVQIQVCSPTAVSTYAFQCPVCRLITKKEAGERVFAALSAAGARVVMWNLPAELFEPKLGPTINHDDLLSFHVALEGDGWREELSVTGRD